MRNFEKLLFWQKSMAIAQNIYVVCKEINNDEKYVLISQLKRAAVSISSNIAEGSAINSDREFNHFLAISPGSAFELQTQLILARKLNLLNVERANEIIKDLSEIQKMIYSFKNTLNLKH